MKALKSLYVIVASTIFAATHRSDADDTHVCNSAIKRARAVCAALDAEFKEIERREAELEGK